MFNSPNWEGEDVRRLFPEENVESAPVNCRVGAEILPPNICGKDGKEIELRENVCCEVGRCPYCERR